MSRLDLHGAMDRYNPMEYTYVQNVGAFAASELDVVFSGYQPR